MRRLTCLVAISAGLCMPITGHAQGRCIRAYGTPGCNTDPIKPVFERTGWRTTTLDHISFRVADPHKEAAFYVALMGWKVRSADDRQVVLDIGDWGTAIFKAAPPESFAAPSDRGGADSVPVRVVVDGFGFDIEPGTRRKSRLSFVNAG